MSNFQAIPVCDLLVLSSQMETAKVLTHVKLLALLTKLGLSYCHDLGVPADFEGLHFEDWC